MDAHGSISATSRQHLGNASRKSMSLSILARQPGKRA